MRFFRIVLLVALLFSGAAIQAQDITEFEEPPPMPGQLIDVGGYRLHITCMGEGSPTVILEPGFARFSFNMRALQEALTAETRVCAYDHAGFDWSDPAPADTPRTTQQLSDELFALLSGTEMDEAYILIAQSLGGFITRLFAAQHADLVAGVILLDATPPEFLLSGITAGQDQGLEALLRSTLAIAQANAWTPQNLFPVLSLTSDIAPDLRRGFIALAVNPIYIETALAEWGSRLANAQSVIDAGELGDVPLHVLVAGERLALASDADSAWVRGQAAQAALSTRSELAFVVGGGHEYYIDRTDAVLGTLRNLLMGR
ncbi:MAG: alpha/beta hydrolase [Chloroflexi bacterium]|nr:alpha/beta hydrolase [Chloroflexota bacterium]